MEYVHLEIKEFLFIKFKSIEYSLESVSTRYDPWLTFLLSFILKTYEYIAVVKKYSNLL